MTHDGEHSSALPAAVQEKAEQLVSTILRAGLDGTGLWKGARHALPGTQDADDGGIQGVDVAALRAPTVGWMVGKVTPLSARCRPEASHSR